MTMGVIFSGIKQIANLQFTRPNKGQIAKCKRALFISDRRAIIELENGAFVVIGEGSIPNGNIAVWGYGASGESAAVLFGMVRMGILKRGDVAKHIADQSEAVERSRRKEAFNLLRIACERLNIPVPDVSSDDAKSGA